MKSLVATLFLLCAVNAYACPDLSGTYNYSPDGTITLKLVQQACAQITFTLSVEGTTSTEVEAINGTPIADGNGSYNTFVFKGDSLVVTPVDANGTAIPGSDTTYTLTASKDMQYVLNIATDTSNPYSDVSIFKRVSN